ASVEPQAPLCSCRFRPVGSPLKRRRSDSSTDAASGSTVQGMSLPIGQQTMYSQSMLTIASRLDVMHRLGRAMADPTRSRILMRLLQGPSYPAVLARELDLTRS